MPKRSNQGRLSFSQFVTLGANQRISGVPGWLPTLNLAVDFLDLAVVLASIDDEAILGGDGAAMSEPLDAAALQAQLASLELRLPDVTADASRESLAWLALCPAWPQQLAVEGFPIEPPGLQTGIPVKSALAAMHAQGLLEAGPGEPPWRDTWYWMPAARRTAVLDDFVATGNISFVRDQLRQIGIAFEQTRWTLPPVIGQFAELARASVDGAMGRV